MAARVCCDKIGWRPGSHVPQIILYNYIVILVFHPQSQLLSVRSGMAARRELRTLVGSIYNYFRLFFTISCADV